MVSERIYCSPKKARRGFEADLSIRLELKERLAEVMSL